jgi:hypothetical protein
MTTQQYCRVDYKYNGISNYFIFNLKEGDDHNHMFVEKFRECHNFTGNPKKYISKMLITSCFGCIHKETGYRAHLGTGGCLN